MKTRKGVSGRAVVTPPTMAPTRTRGRQKKNLPGDPTPMSSSPSLTVCRAVTPASSSISSRPRSRQAEPAAQMICGEQTKFSAGNKIPFNGVLKDATPIAARQIDSNAKEGVISFNPTSRANQKFKQLDITLTPASPNKLRNSSLKTPPLLVKSTRTMSKIHMKTQSPTVPNTVGKRTTGNDIQGISNSKPSRKSNNLSSSKSPGLDRNTSMVTSISSSTPLASNIGSVSSVSDFSDTASPIIRTRKPNLKYADFALPSNSFFKKVLLKNIEPGTPVFSEKNLPSTMASSRLPVQNESSPVVVKDNSLSKSSKSPRNYVACVTPGESPVPSVKELSNSTSRNKSLLGRSKIKLASVKSSKASSKKMQPNKTDVSNQINQSIINISLSRVQGVKTRVNRKPNPKYPPLVSPKISPMVSKSTRIKSTSPKAITSTHRQRRANSTKVVTVGDSHTTKKNPSRSKNVLAPTVDKPSASRTLSEKNRQGKSNLPVLSSPVKLSQCSIQLAVFTSPPPGAVSKVVGPIPSGNLSNVLLKPRLSKREQLALALRQSKLSDSVDISRVVENTSSTLAEQTVARNVMDKKPASKIKFDRIGGSASRTTSGAPNSSSVQSTGEMKKLPVWSKVSPIKNKALSKRILGELYNLSFTPEEDAPTKSKPKKKNRSKIVKGKPKPVYTKSKLLTTDPEFNKAFPSMFGVQSFYSGSTGNQSVQAASNSKQASDLFETNQRCPSPAFVDLDDNPHMDEVEVFDDPYNDLPQENSTENFVPPPYETASSFVSNSTNFNIPAIVISAAAITAIPAALASAAAAPPPPLRSNDGSSTGPSNQAAKKDNNSQFNIESNNNASNNASNKSIPTPAATRIMSKLVGGTSTPFNEQVRNPALTVDRQSPTFDIGPEQTSSPPPPPATVSEQIQVCFGFDESDEDEDNNRDDLSLNLSPVRRTTNMGGLSHHSSSMVSMMSDGGWGVKEVAPTRCVPIRVMGAPSFSSFSSSRTANNNTTGMSKSAGVQQTLRDRTGKATNVACSRRAAHPIPQTDAETGPVSFPTNLSSSSQAKANDAFVTMRKAPSNVSACKSPRAADDALATNEANTAELPPTSVNFDESQLFDEASVASPTKNRVSSQPSHETNEQQQAQRPHQPVATPEKSFSKPPRKSYDRRSLDESRRMLLESLAGGAPDSGDEEADQEDLSQVVTRRKKKPLTNSNERRLQQRKTKVVDASSKRSAAKRPAGATIANPDTSQEEDEATPPAAKRVKPILKSAKARANKAPPAAARTKQTKLKVVKINPPILEESGDAAARMGCNSSVTDSSASSSGIFSLSSKTKKPSKSVAFEQTVNDWASDVNSHFSEIEDCELVLA